MNKENCTKGPVVVSGGRSEAAWAAWAAAEVKPIDLIALAQKAKAFKNF